VNSILKHIGITETHTWWLVTVSAVMFAVGIVTLPWLLARIPKDYFVENQVPLASWKETRPVWRWGVLAIRNVAGALFAILGVVMLFAPGQGVLTLLVGISMMTFPGKRTLELKLIRMKGVLTSINWLRRKSGHEPLELPDGQGRQND
jgi:hypothetical protein